MEIGMTLPVMAPGLDRDTFLSWCERIDAGFFASIAAGERISFYNPDITAVVALSDQLAIGATQAAFRLGYDVPGDVSVVGFDDIPRASTWDVPLTTIRQPLVDKGRRAADLLRNMITGDSEPVREMLPIELVVRTSSGPAPSR